MGHFREHLILSLLIFILSALAAPSAIQPEVSYVPEPNRRGTLGLLWNSTSTFILCIWTAIHPNVVPVQGRRAKFYYKLAFMSWALVIPELVLCVAVVQLQQAQEVLKKWNDAWGDEVNKDPSTWLGMRGAFFVVMGGFVIEAKEKSDGSTSDLVTTVGVPGFIKLLDEGVIQGLVRDKTLTRHHFHHSVIEDKANADSIAKLVVTIQILWMVIQSIARNAAGLPITLLEVHVLIQITYSVMAYFCWWYKPHGVAEPISLPLDYLLGYNIDQENYIYSKHQLFITESRTSCTFMHMFYRAAYDVIRHLSDNIFELNVELWGAILAVANGALHIAVWNAFFPTLAERIIWRVSAIGLGVFPTVVYFVIAGKGFDRHFIKVWYKMRFVKGWWLDLALKGIEYMGDAYQDSIENEINQEDGHGSDCWPKGYSKRLRSALLGIATFCMLSYITCILYLTFEAFISLRRLPAAAYYTIPWSSILPHI